MIKNLICAIVAALFGVVITTHQKDQKILELQKRLAHYSGHEYHSEVFMAGAVFGHGRGVIDEQLRRLEKHANQN